MVCLTDKFPLVDLYTHDKELEDLMLGYYPQKILPEQHQIDETMDKEKVYCFYSLFEPALSAFLEDIEASKFEYQIRNKFTGKLIKVNKPQSS